MATTEQVREILQRHDRIKGARGVWNSHWREAAERVLPEYGNFDLTPTPGSKRSEKIFDSTAVNALPKFASAMESILIPMTQKWHGMRTQMEDKNQQDDVKRWLEKCRDILFSVRSRPAGRFQPNINTALRSVGVFGNGIVFVEDEPGRNILYRGIDLARCWMLESFAGAIDTVHREFTATARQLKQKFGDLPEGIRARAEKELDREFTILHCVRPGDEYQDRKYRHFNFSAWYLCMETQEQLEESGYRKMPYAFGRFDVAPAESYGRSPAMAALADIKMLNEMAKTNIRMAHRAVDPPLLMPNDGVLQAFSLRPGALNYGGVDEQGRQLVHPLQGGGQLPVSLEMEDQRRRSVNDSFYVTLFQVLVENPRMTATEAMLRAQEKGQLLGPSGSRLQGDLFGPIIAREFDILWNAGVIPRPPRGIDIDEVFPEYTAPINRLMRSEEGAAMLRWAEQMLPIAQLDPSAMDIVDTEAWGRELADIDGVPMKVLLTPEAVQEKREGRAQQQQVDQATTAAPAMGQALESLTQAQVNAQSAGPALPLPLAA